MVRGPPETPAPPNACETALYTPPDTAAIKKSVMRPSIASRSSSEFSGFRIASKTHYVNLFVFITQIRPLSLATALVSTPLKFQILCGSVCIRSGMGPLWV